MGVSRDLQGEGNGEYVTVRTALQKQAPRAGNGDEHVILPEIITPAMVIEALKKLEMPATTLR